MNVQLNAAAKASIEAAEEADAALQTALDTFFQVTARLEAQAAPDALYSEADAAMGAVTDELRRVAWLAGYQCGRQQAQEEREMADAADDWLKGEGDQ